MAMLFAISSAITIVWCAAMSAMHAMPMPGGWTMSMVWMRLPGQSWPGAALSFLGMWSVMMVAMMLPSLAPTLWRYFRAVGRAGGIMPGLQTLQVGLGYYFVWFLVGAITYPPGVALAALVMQQPALSRDVPVMGGLMVVTGGLLQFTAWKSDRLVSCRLAAGYGRTLAVDTGVSWRYGLRLGLDCVCSCIGQMLILLAIGIMDLRAMAFVTAAITAERIAPAGEGIARIIGAVAVVAGASLILRAAGSG